MKRFNLFLLGFFFTTIAFSQINKVDSKGKKQGPWEKTYPKSVVLEFKGQFKDDKPVGDFTYYYPSNKLKAVIKHSPSGRSEAFFYHENGKIMTYGIYRDMKKDSLWFQYNEDGKIVFTENYLNDKLHGKKTVYYHPNKETGVVDRILSISYYKEGKADGDHVEYFEFGGKRVQGKFKNGLREGDWVEYQPSGKPLIKNHFKEGKKNGWCYSYDSAGKESNKVFYWNGNEKKGKDLDFILKQLKEKGINPNE